MNTYETNVKMPNGQLVRVQCQAQSPSAARQIFESQYGKSAVLGGPIKVS
jgi:hypothetical protein